MVDRFAGRNNDRGSVLILVAVSIGLLLALTALVVDLGHIYVARQRAQDVCDAAVLAGAWGLALHQGDLATAQSQATLLADTCAASNNEARESLLVMIPETSEPGVTVDFPQGWVTDDAGRSIAVDVGEAIRVQGSVTVEYGFARIFDLTERDVYASATAIMQRATGLCSDLFVPIAASNLAIFGDATTPPIAFGEPYVLHVPRWQEGFLGPGNYLSLRFPDDGGASDYRDRLAGDKGVICFSSGPDTPVETKPGSIGNATYQGLVDRLSKETDPRFTLRNPNAWENWVASYDQATGRFAATWRMAIVPIIVDNVEAVNGTRPVDLAGFAGFFISTIYDGQDGVHQKGEVEGYFVQGAISGQEVQWVFPLSGSDADSPQFMWTIRLVS